ncbi:hypothetical protein GXW82_03765 [Streptacidiphilus sp. 4-A2]|nr:hypothetical protein [Streptacidiphilus sp. 4-A2]
MLVLTLPTSASAAGGEFRYTFHDRWGYAHEGRLVDPADWECITLREVADWNVPPAESPWNDTNAEATVYTGDHCDGDQWRLRPHGAPASDRLKLRSVRFTRP